MYFIAQKYCFFSGILQVSDVCKAEKKPNEYVIEINGTLPKSEIQTRGISPAIICAHNLPFEKRKVGAAFNDFTVLYTNPDKSFVSEFWTITVIKGKAMLKIISIKDAERLYDQLPKKIQNRNFLFSPEAYKRDVKSTADANRNLKEAEKERIKAAEKAAKGPLERLADLPDPRNL